MKEIWRDINIVKGINFKRLYQVSNFGRIKSFKRYKKLNNNKLVPTYGGILTNQKTQYGYETIALSKDKKIKTIFIHKLVALEFIKNIFNKEFVNHINGIKDDNRVENLEWVTRQENVDHAWATGLMTGQHNSKEVLMLSLDGKPLIIFSSQAEGGRMTKAHKTKISECCLGKRKTAGGYKWEFAPSG